MMALMEAVDAAISYIVLFCMALGIIEIRGLDLSDT